MATLLKYLPFIYLAAISLISLIVTCYDKIAAKRFTKHRVPEATLMILAMLGGSAAMLVTMLIIRHKTRHKKFMIGIPAIIILQLAVFATACYLSIR